MFSGPQLQSTPFNAYSFAEGSQADRRDGGVVNFTFFNNDTEEIPVSGLPEDKLITIQFAQLAASAEENFTAFDMAGENSSFSHSFLVEGPGESVFIELRPGNDSMVYALFVSFNDTPTLDKYDWMFILPNKSEEESDEFTTTSSTTMLTSTNSTMYIYNISHSSTTQENTTADLWSTTESSTMDYSTTESNSRIFDNPYQTPSNAISENSTAGLWSTVESSTVDYSRTESNSRIFGKPHQAPSNSTTENPTSYSSPGG